MAGTNWAIVASAGEVLRYQVGLSNENSLAWVSGTLASLHHRWTLNGIFKDCTGCNETCNPILYGTGFSFLERFYNNNDYDDMPERVFCPEHLIDHFPRKYILLMLSNGYDGANASEYLELNQRAAWVSLLMQSPWGEMPTGGTQLSTPME